MEDMLERVTHNNEIIDLLITIISHKFYVLQIDIRTSIYTKLSENGSLEPKHVCEYILDVNKLKRCFFKLYYEQYIQCT